MENTKTQDLKSDLKRQAHNSLRGYLYQIWHSVNAWLELNEDEILYLEGAEDFDTVSDSDATVTQVKATQAPITLRSQDVNDAINHYWELRMSNSDRNVKFRFLTSSEIGEEQGSPFGRKQPGLDLWNNCSGDEAVVTTISDFLQTASKISEEVKDFLKQAEPQEIYEHLIEPITWETGSKDARSVEQSIGEKLVHHGDRHGISPCEARKVVNHLLKEALTVATQKEIRELTRARFLEIFEGLTMQSVSTQYLRHLQMQAAILGEIGTTVIGSSPDFTIQSRLPVQNAIPPLYPDVAPRKELLISIQAKLQSERIVVIYGGSGRGKTTLANLTAQDSSDSWLWQNFTNRNSPQVFQQLQLLATQVCNLSSQPNVVLDDLNLEPHQLQGYEEVLRIVVYRVLERGAKLLITSQHELPNNLIRHFGVSPSIIVHVSDFTISEIEQFARQLGCPADDVKICAQLIQLHTSGHPRLVHAQLDRLREAGWRQPDTIGGILKPPKKVVEERVTARQLLTKLPTDYREFLYRLSLVLTFRRDYALDVGEIPEPVSHPGDIFDQLVGPWIDRIDESYYTISPLLRNAAQEVWPEGKIKQLHAQIANAILNATDSATLTEAWAVIVHSIGGQNKEAFIAVINALMTAPENDWGKISQEFSMLIHIKIDPPEELFPGDAFVNHLFRSLQYHIAVEVEPKRAPKILEIWDKETKPHEPRQLYLLDRLMLATEALRSYQLLLPAKQMVGYLKEIIDITDNNDAVKEMYYDGFMGQLEEHETDAANYFSFLFSFVVARRPIYTVFLSDLIDALDELPPRIRSLLLADFKEYSTDPRLLIDGVWFAEANLKNPNWDRCLQVFDKVIEKALAWNYPHLAAASARGKAIIHYENLRNAEAAQKVLQDIASRVGTLPVIELEQANVYLNQERYKEALSIYERILPEWNPPLDKLGIALLEEYRRASICAAHLDDWEKAATFFETGAKKVETIEHPERFIGLCADAGFAQFKTSNMPESIKLLKLALEKFEMLPQDNTDVKYITLKKRLAYTIRWMAEHNRENSSSGLVEPPIGLCSNPEPNEDISAPPDFPMGYIWLYLAQVEYRFAHGMSILEQALQIANRDAHPVISSSLSLLQVQHDFRNKAFDNLPQRIHQLANAYSSMQEHSQTEERIGTKGTDSVPFADLSSVASVKDIVVVLVTALLVGLRTSTNVQPLLVKWRFNSSELPIKENLTLALDLIESMLSGDLTNAVTVMNTPDAQHENRLAAALRVVHSTRTRLGDLFCAHAFIATSLIGNRFEDPVLDDVAELFSSQWLEKIRFRSILKSPTTTVPEIERACKSSETGKKKIGQILIAARQAI